MGGKLSEIDTYFYEELEMLTDFSHFVFSHSCNKRPGRLLKGGGSLLFFFKFRLALIRGGGGGGLI